MLLQFSAGVRAAASHLARTGVAAAARQPQRWLSGGEHQRDQPPPPPKGLCCESGCVDCVWVQYAAAVLRHHRSAAEAVDSARIRADVMARVAKEVDDPAIRAFIEMELDQMLGRLMNAHS